MTTPLSRLCQVSSLALLTALAACAQSETLNAEQGETQAEAQESATQTTPSLSAIANPETWPAMPATPLDPAVEARIDSIMAQMTLEQKVGQVIQADSGSVTPDEVRDYHLGSVLSGGNSAPGPLPYADTGTWLAAADAYFDASVEDSAVDFAVPIIWGIDAVHGHANLRGATVFPHNIGLGAARNPDLIEEIYRVTALELLVSGHDWTFAPTLAVPRDDRWGRTYEGFSEDPEIVAEYAPRIVYGLQGHPGQGDFLGEGRVLSSAKHFLADGGTQNGRDQGDALISEAELRDIHAAGYYTAIPAGVQTVMASFSGWNGIRMHGNESLMTGVLKDRMGFQGFIVGDWNGHGLIEGCTATDCPESLNAGLDMYMAPDSWRGLWHSTLAHVQSGEIPMERLDDAVRRILRVKINMGLFEMPRPSERVYAGREDLLGSDEHRAIARQAVRESLVLLKNNDQLLPLDAGSRVLVIGPDADNIGAAAGGWTLSWQGGDFPNSEFPNADSILSGIEAAVTEAGGELVYDADGTSDIEADVVIAVYGERPYAEFQGDRDHLDYQSTSLTPQTLAAHQDAGRPVVSVFLSGRPMWTNPEINASDAFIAAWLPGSEGAGVADLLFQSEPGYDFTGRLSYSWPADGLGGQLNRGDTDYAPLFAYGYGLSFGDAHQVGQLSEDSGVEVRDTSYVEQYYSQGQAIAPWAISTQSMDVSATDRTAQEDSLQLVWNEAGAVMMIEGPDAIDLSRQANGAMELSFQARSVGAEPARIAISVDCTDTECADAIDMEIAQGNWTEYRISLSCFSQAGRPLTAITRPFLLTTRDDAGQIGLGDIQLRPDTDAATDCGNI